MCKCVQTCLPSRGSVRSVRSVLAVLSRLLFLSSPDQTGFAEAADQNFDNWLPAQPPHPTNFVHSGHQPTGSAPPSGHHRLHPDPLPGPCAVPACPRTAAGHTHPHHLFSLLKTSPVLCMTSAFPLPYHRPSWGVSHMTALTRKLCSQPDSQWSECTSPDAQ